jgi:hypothetical protein
VVVVVGARNKEVRPVRTKNLDRQNHQNASPMDSLFCLYFGNVLAGVVVLVLVGLVVA